MRSHHAALLTATEEAALARAIEAGVLASRVLAGEWPLLGASEPELRRIEAEGRQAWQRFLLANVRLVWMVVRHASARSGIAADELFQEGFVALAQALQRFDHTRGRFTTYALPKLKQHLALVTSSRSGMLGIPPHRAVELRRALVLADRLGQELGRTARPEELAELLGRSLEWTRALLDHQPPVSLEASGASDWVAAREPGDPAEAVYHARLVAELERLPGDQRAVVRLRYGFADGVCRSYREVAALIGLSPSSVRRIEQRALAALRGRHAVADPEPGRAAG